MMKDKAQITGERIARRGARADININPIVFTKSNYRSFLSEIQALESGGGFGESVHPLILVTTQANKGGVNLYNVQSLLQNGKFIDPETAKDQWDESLPPPKSVKFEHHFKQTGLKLTFEFQESTTTLRPEQTNRLVGMFVYNPDY